jgi:ligand-binding sensor domain-containing protein
LLRSIFIILIFICFNTIIKAQNPYFKNITTKDGLAGNVVYYIIEDKQGYIWISTSYGITRFDGINYKTFTVTNGLPDNEVLQITEDKKGRLWLSSMSSKFCFIENNKIFTSANTPALKEMEKGARSWVGYANNKILTFYEDGSNLHNEYDVETLNLIKSDSVFDKNDHELDVENKSVLYVSKYCKY